jgi:protein-arginine kinase activator protein McsA
VIKKIALLLFVSCFLFSAENLTNEDVADKKDKAEVKKIEQKIINEKYEEAAKLRDKIIERKKLLR